MPGTEVPVAVLELRALPTATNIHSGSVFIEDTVKLVRRASRSRTAGDGSLRLKEALPENLMLGRKINVQINRTLLIFLC